MKASGSYASLVRGVSQQVPQDRQPGQHTEMVNMIPDPVKGLTRRHGSRWVAEASLDLDPDDLPAMIADTDNWRTFEYSNANKDYVILYRTAAIAAGSTLPLCIVFNRTDSVFLTVVRNAVDTFLDAVDLGGVSAIASIGRYVFIAGNTTVPTSTSTNLWTEATNRQRCAVWVRGGAYAREFTVKVTKESDSSQVEFAYTTPTSSYPGTLDTSGVPVYAADPVGGTTIDTEAAYIIDAGGGVTRAELSWHAWTPTLLSMTKGGVAMTNTHPAAPTTGLQYAWAPGARYATFHVSNLSALDVTMSYTHVKTVTNPNYSKTVTDITNAFNTQVTNWIGTAAEATQPDNIAEQLRLAAVAAGLTATREGSTILLTDVKAVAVTDGGDGTLMRGVAQEITSIDQVTAVHWIGKVVKVRARNANEAFYLKAIPRDPNITSGPAEVTWVESAGIEHAITGGLVYGMASGSTFYLASSAALLTTAGAPGTHPTFPVSTAGDADSSPLPFFIGKRISYLGVFQDRLLVGAGAVLRCSKIGDYLNFFRSSILTVLADDPLEMLSQGSEDDELRYSVLYDRDLIIFGKKRQYAVSGRVALTPTSANMPVMSSHSNAADAPPLAVGGVIFYGQRGEKSSSVHQIQPGQVAESPESFIASSQVDTYLLGQVIELSNHAKPTHLFVRTTGRRQSVYCFSYLDKQGEGRVLDAWGRWDFNEALGPVIGMSPTTDGLLVYHLRTGPKFDASGEDTWVVADLCPLTTGLASYPYLDSIRPWPTVETSEGAVHPQTPGDWYIAFDDSSEFFLIGDPLALADDLLEEFPSATGPVVGAEQPCYFEPTTPFVRDRNSKAIMNGRLTVTKKVMSIADSSGCITELTTRAGTETATYNGRIMGDPNNIIGREPISTQQVSIPIGKETKEYTLRIRARKWMPLTLTALEWVGQFFSRTQRF